MFTHSSRLFVLLIFIFSAGVLYASQPNVASGDEPSPVSNPPVSSKPPVIAGKVIRMNRYPYKNNPTGFLKGVQYVDLLFEGPDGKESFNKVTITYEKINNTCHQSCLPDTPYCPNTNPVKVRIVLDLVHTTIKSGTFEADSYSGIYDGNVEGKMYYVFFESSHCKNGKCIALYKTVNATLKEMNVCDEDWSTISLRSSF